MPPPNTSKFTLNLSHMVPEYRIWSKSCILKYNFFTNNILWEFFCTRSQIKNIQWVVFIHSLIELNFFRWVSWSYLSSSKTSHPLRFSGSQGSQLIKQTVAWAESPLINCCSLRSTWSSTTWRLTPPPEQLLGLCWCSLNTRTQTKYSQVHCGLG